VKDRHLVRTALLYPLRDLLGFFYWAASYGDSEIVWRNQIYRLTRGGLMVAPEETLETEPALTA
jgi:ceramide glucosyltransferase